jgi:phosphohistidine swiveling domain-containing protein
MPSRKMRGRLGVQSSQRRGEGATLPGYVQDIQAARRRDRYGAKAENLRFLAEKGYRVPITWVIPFEAWEDHLRDGPGTLTRLEADLERTLAPAKSYAVRSSANVEDRRDRSFAGQFKTILNVSGAQEVARAVEEVWASVAPEMATDYLRTSSQSGAALQMGVIVQEMVPQVFSGVAFSINPLTGAAEVVVEAVQGGGDSLVQKGVTPMRWVWNGSSLASREEAGAISPAIIEEVASTTQRISSDFGAPVDLEWVCDGRKVYIVQLRDITARGKVTVYSNLFSREVLPGLIKPLVWSVNVPLVNGAWARFLSGMTGLKDLDPQAMAKQFYGRAYFNLSLVGRVWRRMGMPEDSLERLMGVNRAQGSFKFSINPQAMTVMPYLLGFLRKHVLLSSELERLIPRKRGRLDELAGEDLRSLSEDQLVERVDALTEVLRDAAYYDVLTALASNLFNRMLESRLRKCGVDPTDFDALRDLQEIHDYYPNERLARLSLLFRALPPERQAALRSRRSEALRELPDDGEFRLAFDDLIKAFGHVSESGSDFSRTTWREDPDHVLSLVQDFQGARPSVLRRSGIEDVQAPAFRRSSLRTAYGKARKFMLLKERMSATYAFGYGLYRIYFLELGRRFGKEQVLAAPEDIFYLNLDEIRQIVAGGCAGNTCNNYRLRVALRKREQALYQDADVPTVIYGEVAPPLTSEVQAELRGTPASGGYHRGKARVVRSPSEFGRVEQGDVLVIPYSDVAWTALFSKAGAVVAESGGLLSHTSIIAREYGIPAVVCVEGAMARIQDGVGLRVDGYNGIVVIEP